jgi:prepilin-type N-terminal cleavage/methylation domain-containing protein
MKKNYSKKGMSLVELLVAIVILSLGMIAFTLLAARAWSFKGYALEQATATAGASRRLTQIIHELRSVRQGDDGSYPIKETGDYSLTVYRDEDGDNLAERVHYFVEDGMLKKGVSESSGGIYPVGDQTIEVLLHYITNQDLTKPFFSYYNNDYPVNTSVPMALPTPYDVRLIRVHIWINIRPIVAPENVNLESFVELRNLNEF